MTVLTNILYDITLGFLPSGDQVSESEWGKYTRFWDAEGRSREVTMVIAWVISLNEDLE